MAVDKLPFSEILAQTWLNKPEGHQQSDLKLNKC